MIIRMPIDLKSLYLNIKNDNQTGHTPTVATPLRQGKSVHTEIAQILNVPENISGHSKEQLCMHLLAKSRAQARIVKAFVFNNISVNGIPVETEGSYCIYIREETDPSNVHFGRQKVHYPQVLDYSDEEITINNQKVLRAISEALKNYAFIVQAFEYDDCLQLLNFDVLIVGENGVPYSKVFLNKRGVGEKFASIFNEYADIYDTEIIAMRSKLGYDKVFPESFMDIMASNKEKAISAVESFLKDTGCKDYFVLSRQYPYSLYDIEIKDGLKKRYLVIRFTSTKVKYFNLQINCIRFLSNFPEQADVYLVTDVNGEPQIFCYSQADLNTMGKTINSVTYDIRG
jgi:hypothetical protein